MILIKPNLFFPEVFNILIASGASIVEEEEEEEEEEEVPCKTTLLI